MKLTGWQKDVVAEIENHPTVRESQEYMSVPDYLVNRDTNITISFPKNANHTAFANYLANRYRAVVIYDDIKHYLTLTSPGVADEQGNGPLNPGTDMMSKFEIFYALHQQQPSIDVETLRKRFEGKQVVVVDRAERCGADIRNFVLDVAPCIVVFLGK